MPTISDIMTRDVATVQLTDTVQTAARQMKELDVGAMPVCDGDTLVGMVTDRDIAVRAVAAGLAPDEATVAAVMTDDVEACAPDDSIDEALMQMGDAQVRRLPVLDADRRIVGIVALGDLATRQGAPVDEALREISESAPGT